MTSATVVFFHGQGGIVTSGGIDQMAEKVRNWPGDVRVKIYDWREWQHAMTDIDSAITDYIIACGYSMGANALTWLLSGVTYQSMYVAGMQKRVMDLGIFIDPTWLSPVSPLTSRTLRRAIHFKNKSLDVVGHAAIPLAPDFPPSHMHVVETMESHLTLDFDKLIQARILNEFSTIIEGA